ncbi:MAG: bifunctional 5,10-methylenetetrahydrofolate dehydrogenase/5,10-methenyltetrahydrofolate cyclohydrolase [Patescibacteria group bacterium]|nr:bifunctional 5,10-methylenetetrahydrofolate dehydrogenase/5,10-methenyltetrahydrofolate cyclohydrolase [Patescibacteria group bacterium]
MNGEGEPTILSGLVARDRLKGELIERISGLKATGMTPALAIIQAGDRADTTSYVDSKKRFAAGIGADVRHVHMDADARQEDVIGHIKTLNADRSVHGIIVQLPLPEGLDRDAAMAAIDPAKDADGLAPTNVAIWSAGGSHVVWPATARGVGELLDFYDIVLKGKNVCVIGRSALVGAPVAALCRAKGAIVTVCHSKTGDLKKETLAADVIISAVGKPGLVTVDHVKPGQVIVDIGISEVGADHQSKNISQEFSSEKIPRHRASPAGPDPCSETDGRHRPGRSQPKRNLIGDVDFKAVKAVLGPNGAISPVPGGVGPMTVLALFENLADLCDRMSS